MNILSESSFSTYSSFLFDNGTSEDHVNRLRVVKKKVEIYQSPDKQLESYSSIHQCCIICVITLNSKQITTITKYIDRPMIIM